MHATILLVPASTASPFVGYPRPSDGPSAADDQDMPDMPLCPICGHVSQLVGPRWRGAVCLNSECSHSFVVSRR